ncbi:MAG: ankyrin repeat domain-containing protein [Luteolibacter sp.]
MITPEEETRYAELQQMALDAARTGDDAVLAPMLEAGMPVNLADEKGNSLLMLASYHGNLETSRLLLRAGASPDQRNARNQTPLAGVAFKGGLEIAKLLVEHGADPNADQGGGRFPIHFAALFGHREMVEYLETVSPLPKTARLRLLARVTSTIRSLFRTADVHVGPTPHRSHSS